MQKQAKIWKRQKHSHCYKERLSFLENKLSSLAKEEELIHKMDGNELDFWMRAKEKCIMGHGGGGF